MEQKMIDSEIPFIYSNGVAMSSNVFDMQIVFFQRTINPNTNEEIMKPLIKVAMSPQHAKQFKGVLEEQIERYEKLNGKIPEVKYNIDEI